MHQKNESKRRKVSSKDEGNERETKKLENVGLSF